MRASVKITTRATQWIEGENLSLITPEDPPRLIIRSDTETHVFRWDLVESYVVYEG